MSDFEASDVQLVVVDPHEPWAAKSLLGQVGFETTDVGFPLLTDSALTVSATYGVAFQVRIHTGWSNRPSTFLIDRDGIIRYAHRAATISDRPSPDTIREELEKL